MRTGCTDARVRLDRTAAGMAQSVDLLTRDDDQ